MGDSKKYNSSFKGRSRAERYRISDKGKKTNRKYRFSEKGIIARKRAYEKSKKNKLIYKSFREQALECDKNRNSFIINPPYANREIIVCLKHKTYCHSKACIKERVI